MAIGCAPKSESPVTQPVTATSPAEAAIDPPAEGISCLDQCQSAGGDNESCELRCEIGDCIEACTEKDGAANDCARKCTVEIRAAHASQSTEASECETECGLQARLQYAACIEPEGSDETACGLESRASHAQCVEERCP